MCLEFLYGDGLTVVAQEPSAAVVGHEEPFG